MITIINHICFVNHISKTSYYYEAVKAYTKTALLLLVHRRREQVVFVIVTREYHLGHREHCLT